ncbi:MAG: hypothetical protein ACE37H_11115 [Phycisphaeraceae bacterium]
MTFALWVIPGCVATDMPPGPEAATDPQASTHRRIASIQAYPAERVFELFELVAVSRHPLAVRAAAVDRMLDADAERFWQTAAARSAQVDDWPMIRLLSERAAQQSDERATPWLIRSWAAPSTTMVDRDRPERSAIEAIETLAPDLYLHYIALPRFEPVDLPTRIAAWTVLCRIGSMDEALAKEQVRPDIARHGPDPLRDALCLCYRWLGVYPTDREGIGRLFTLIDHTPQSRWETWSDWWGLHRIDMPRTLALRHLPAITRISPDRYGWARKKWLAYVRARTENGRHVYRGQEAGDRIVSARQEGLDAQADALGIADLVVIAALLETLDEPAVVAELFKQADADHADTATEHGGVITWDENDKPVAKAFAPLLKRHDQVYYASNDCVRAMHTGLAHYHFHAQKHNNAVWAGPGKGDLGFADRLHANCVVFTFIDADTLNADAYFPGGIIVDLGCQSVIK